MTTRPEANQVEQNVLVGVTPRAPSTAPQFLRIARLRNPTTNELKALIVGLVSGSIR